MPPDLCQKKESLHARDGLVGVHDHAWKVVELAGKACDLFEPATPERALLFLHGLGPQTILGDSTIADLFERHAWRVIAPRGGESWWLDRLYPPFDPDVSPERFLLDRLLPALTHRWQVQPGQVALLGIGMGGQGALRLAFRHPRTFPAVAALLPAIDFHRRYRPATPLALMFPNAEAARQQTAILHVHPLSYPRRLFFAADPADRLWYDGAQRLAQKLCAVGVQHECDLLSTTAGNGPAYLTRLLPRALEFLSVPFSPP